VPQPIIDASITFPSLAATGIDGSPIEYEDTSLSFTEAVEDDLDMLSDSIVLSDTAQDNQELITDSIALSDELQANSASSVADSFLVTEEASAGWSEADGFSVSDALEQTSSAQIMDTFALSDARASDVTVSVEDSVRVRERVTQVTAMLLSDTIEISETTAETLGHTVVDSFGVGDTTSYATTESHEVTDTLQLSDGLELVATTFETDSIALSDTLVHIALSNIEDSIALSDDMLLVGQPTAQELSSAIVVTDALQLVSSAVTNVVDTLELTDEILHRDAEAIAWCMNPESTASWIYENWQFTDMAQTSAGTFAVGREGIVEVTGDTDAGELIPAEVAYGFVDFGSEYKKRMESLWAGYTAQSALEAGVETYGQGYPVYWYGMPARDANQPLNNYIHPGRALVARYWRLSLRNSEGGAFDVKSLQAEIIPVKRRA